MSRIASAGSTIVDYKSEAQKSFDKNVAAKISGSTGKISLSFAAPARAELSVTEIVQDIQRQVVRFKCRLIDIFQDFDKTKNGVISRVNYLRAFGRSQIKISEAHKIKLANAFCTAGDMGDVNYKRLCQRIDEVNVIKGLDKNPNASTATAAVHAVTTFAGSNAVRKRARNELS